MAQHDHAALIADAQARYTESADQLRAKEPTYCATCGMIGYHLMSIALLEAQLAQPDLAEDERAELGADLAMWVSAPLPAHAQATEDASSS